MTVLSGQTIARLKIITPLSFRTKFNGMTYGVGPAGYDVRIAEDHELWKGEFQLGSIMEHINMPNDVLGVVHDKSTWARQGLAVQNTVIEPGWRGALTLELTNHGTKKLRIPTGTPIAQIIFHRLDEPTSFAYDGKYQDQKAGPQPARFE